MRRLTYNYVIIVIIIKNNDNNNNNNNNNDKLGSDGDSRVNYNEIEKKTEMRPLKGRKKAS